MKRLLTKEMMAILAIAISTVLCAGSARAQDANDPNANNLFDVNRVLTFNITMDTDDWDELVASCPDSQCIPDANGDHEYWQATLQCGTVEPMLVGIRRKNDLAEPSEADPQKVSLKIDTNLYVPGQLFAGKKKFSLENGSESALVTEVLAWNIYQAASDSFVSGRAAWVKVYVNGSYKGLYGNVEQIDKVYLTDHGLDNDGFLYKHSEYEGEVQRTREDETSPFEFSWYPFDHPDYMDETIPPPTDWLDQTPWRVNILNLLALAATENFISNTDGAVQKGGNFWYYDLSTDPNSNDPNFQVPRWYLPWDLDTTIKSQETDRDILNPVQGSGGHLWQGLIRELDESDTPFVEPIFQTDYLTTYKNLMDGPLELSEMMAMVNSIEPVIAAEVDADPYTQTGGAAEEFQRIRDFLTDRTDSVNSQLEALIPPPGFILLDDGFEAGVWDANWNNISHNWVEDNSIYKSGTASAKAPAEMSDCYFTCNALDASDATAIHIKFWFMKDDTEEVEDFILSYYNGTSYVDICDLDTLGSDDEWLHYTDTITDSNFFVADFKIRFHATPEKNENVWVDDVIVTKEAPLIISGYILDPNSAPIDGVLVDANNAGGADTTDLSGYYEVWVPFNWSGTVTPTKAGYTFDPNNIAYTNVTEDQIEQDYIAILNTYTISGTVMIGGSGLAGVLMSGLPSDPITDANGFYSDTVDYGFTDTVIPTKAEYTFVPPSTTYSNVTSDQLNQDYTATLNTYTISGTVTVGGSDLAGVLMSGLPSAPVTDANGFYSDTVDYGWSGMVTPTKEDYTFEPSDKTYSAVTANQVNQDYVGTSIYDLNGDGVIADLADLAEMCGNWLQTGPDIKGDLYEDDIVNLLDFAKFALVWQVQ